MHEVDVMRSALEAVFRIAAERHARSVRTIGLQIGALSAVDPEALRFAFRALAPGTQAESASLEIDWVPAACRCDDCDLVFEPTPPFYLCPQCCLPCDTVIRGAEMSIAYVEVTYDD